jgi:hypothetical protein
MVKSTVQRNAVAERQLRLVQRITRISELIYLSTTNLSTTNGAYLVQRITRISELIYLSTTN